MPRKFSRKMLKAVKQQMLANEAAHEETAEETEQQDECQVPTLTPQLRRELRRQQQDEGHASFKHERRQIKWAERRRRIEEGIIRYEWNVSDGQLVRIKTPTKHQLRLARILHQNNLEPGQTGVVIDLNDVMPHSGHGKDGKNKKLTVLVNGDIQEWDASWIEDLN